MEKESKTSAKSNKYLLRKIMYGSEVEKVENVLGK